MSASAREAVRTGLRGVGQTLITLGVITLLFVAYELWFTNFYTAREQHDLRHQLQQQWGTAPTASPGASTPPALVSVKLGEGMAILRIPRLGRTYAKVIVEGVGREDLKKGPGHYPGTALPGQVGNFVVSGHRTTYGAPFNRLDELRRGDPVVVETSTDWFTYHVTTTEVVDPSDVSVIAPVPDRPGETPTRRVLTFTTCNPKYSASQRLIVHGLLVERHARSPGYVPPALEG